MSDLNFEAMLAEHNQNYKDASEFSDWMPPDEDYLVTVLKCDKGVSEKEGQAKLGWWKLTARIEAPEKEKLDGKEFSLGFYNTNAMGILKGQARALNGGEPVGSITEADAIFTAAPGQILRVKVATSTSKKNGKEYTNAYVQEVVAVEEVAPNDNGDPPQGDSAAEGDAQEALAE
jgi:hypothetical protein